MENESSGVLSDDSPPSTHARYVTIGVVILFLGSIGLGLFAKLAGTQTESFRFIALLIIFMTALAASSTLFFGLRMANPGEAFGLPAGSVRAVLAVGIMILFVVFGLPLLYPQQSDPIAAKEVSVPYEQLAAAVRLHRDQGLNVRVLSYGAPAVAAAGAAPATPPAAARIEVFGRADTQSAAQTDIAKQMLTAIITLLTTVIGFYFGSRSATDGMKQTDPDAQADRARALAFARGLAPPVDPARPDPPPPAAAPAHP